MSTVSLRSIMSLKWSMIWERHSQTCANRNTQTTTRISEQTARFPFRFVSYRNEITWMLSETELQKQRRPPINLLICCLFKDAVSISNYIQRRIIGWLTNKELKGHEKKLSRLTEGTRGLRKTTKTLRQDSRPPGRDLNPGRSKYEAGVLSAIRNAVILFNYEL
jgi:hypothetical protein